MLTYCGQSSRAWSEGSSISRPAPPSTLDQIGNVVAAERSIIGEAVFDQQVEGEFGEGARWAAISGRGLAGDAFDLDNAAFEDPSLIARGKLIGPFMQPAVMADLMAVLDQKLDGPRVGLDAPAGHEHGLAHSEVAPDLHNPRDSHTGAIAQ